MAEIETIDNLRASLARRREHADEALAGVTGKRIRIPDAAELLQSRPVELVLRHPALTGIAIGVIYLIGPMRLLRLAATAAGLVQSALTARSLYRTIATRDASEDTFGNSE